MSRMRSKQSACQGVLFSITCAFLCKFQLPIFITVCTSESSSSFSSFSLPCSQAVPTTDLPLHEVPQLLPWFRDLCKHRIFPLLGALYPNIVGKTDGSQLRINDGIKMCSSPFARSFEFVLAITEHYVHSNRNINDSCL